MKKLFALPLALVFASACSEPTTSPADSSISELKPRAFFAAAGLGSEYDFEGNFGAAASPFTPSIIGTYPVTTTSLEAQYLGQFTNATLTMSSGYTATAHLNLSLVIVGTWDGIAKGKYGADTWEIKGYCGSSVTGTAARSFVTSFSNKHTTKQNFPDQVGGAAYAGQTGAVLIGALGFSSGDEVRVTNRSVSSYSAVYNISVAYPTCTGGATEVTWVMRNPSQEGQETYDEFWALDNVSVTETPVYTVYGS